MKKPEFLRTKSGFTLVELLIVIVVIAILASISVVAYRGIQSRAHDTAVRSDLRNVYIKLEMYKADNGTFPHDPAGAGGAVIRNQLEDIDLRLTTGSYDVDRANTNLLYIASSDGQRFALLAYPKGGPTYLITNEQSSPREYTGNPNVEKSGYPGNSTSKVIEGLDMVGSGNYYIYNNNEFRVWD